MGNCSSLTSCRKKTKYTLVRVSCVVTLIVLSVSSIIKSSSKDFVNRMTAAMHRYYVLVRLGIGYHKIKTYLIFPRKKFCI